MKFDPGPLGQMRLLTRSNKLSHYTMATSSNSIILGNSPLQKVEVIPSQRSKTMMIDVEPLLLFKLLLLLLQLLLLVLVE